MRRMSDFLSDVKPCLSLQTATANAQTPASLALWDGTALHERTLPPHGTAAQLLPAIEALLAQAGLEYHVLDRLALTIGPGSFTGIRIGLAVAHSIAFACPELTLSPVTTLEAVAASYQGNAQQLCICMRAGKGEVYLQHFHRVSDVWQASDDIALTRPESFAGSSPETACLGNAREMLELMPDFHLIDPAAEHVLLACQCVDRPDERSPEPLYIRPPDAVLPAA